MFKKVSYQIVFFSVLVSLIPLLLVFSLYTARMNRLVEEELLNSHARLITQYVEGVEYKLATNYESIAKLADNTVILDTLYSLSTDRMLNPQLTGKLVTQEVSKYLSRGQREMKNYMIYTTAPQPIYGVKAVPIASARRESWYPLYQKRAGDSFFSLDGQPTLSLLKELHFIDRDNIKSYPLGFVKLDLFADNLFAPPFGVGNDSGHYEIDILDAQSHLVYSSSPSPGESLLLRDGAKLLREIGGELPPDGAQYGESMVFCRPLERIGATALLFTDSGSIEARQLSALGTVLPLAALGILLMFAVAYVLARHFTRRVSMLTGKMNRVETGDLTGAGNAPIGGKDELALLDRHFDRMVQRLNVIIQENYAQKLENKETQLRNLQLQINPHFLYNTLETVSSLAAIHKAYGICDITEKLGEIFRYSLGKESEATVPLADELHHVRNYVFIQKTRYGSRFEYEERVGEALRSERVPRFILQPLVENALAHGLTGGGRTGKIDIAVRAEEKALFVEVCDNGAGMSSERLKWLREHIDAPVDPRSPSESMGVQNVHQRIRLVCGAGFGLTIESAPGEGSRFLLRLPRAACALAHPAGRTEDENG